MCVCNDCTLLVDVKICVCAVCHVCVLMLHTLVCQYYGVLISGINYLCVYVQLGDMGTMDKCLYVM